MLLISWTDELLQVAFSGRSSFSCEESSWKKCMQFSFFPAEADKRMNCPFWRWKREIQFPNRKWEILSNPKVHFLSCPTQFSPFLISNTHQHHLLQGLSLSGTWFFSLFLINKKTTCFQAARSLWHLNGPFIGQRHFNSNWSRSRLLGKSSWKKRKN